MMTRLKYTLLSLVLLAASFAVPFGLNTVKKYDAPPEIENFKYFFGDKSYGTIYYLGTKDISGFETELQLSTDSAGRVYSALLILGPAGMDSTNCIKRYNEVTKMLNKKYGHYVHVREIKDPIVDDLVTDTICDPIRIEAYEVVTTWRVSSPKMSVVSRILGDDDGYYIEVEYIFGTNPTKKELIKLL